MADEVVITGIGIMSPIGCGEGAFWKSLCEGRSGAAPVDCLDTTDLPRKVGCQIREPLPPLSAPLEGIGRASRLAVAAAREAMQSSRLSIPDLNPARVNVTMGTTMGETQFIEDRLTAPATEWLSKAHAAEILSGRPGCIARHVRADLGADGVAVDLYGACAAGNMALATARRQLLDGHCDVAIAGGADGFSRLAFLGFMRLRIMAAELCRPFDDKRDGLFVGEGAGVFVLERESSARARAAPIRARLSGAAMTCENYHPTRPHPDGDGLSRAIHDALQDADVAPGDIDYVNAHGTGTPQNDAIEVKVMEQCFRQGVAFSSIKALTGHTMGAAGAIEAASCVLMLEHRTLIPTWHLDNVLQPCGLDAVRGGVRTAQVRHTLNNSAGFGGYNSAVVLSAV
jgi:3-oxoacyl-[acyl-carrier-protein] synthase II